MHKPELGFYFNSSDNKPSALFLLKLKLCYANGIKAVCFSDTDLNKDDETINGYSWTKDGLIREISALPSLLEYGGGTEKRQYFREKCTIIDDFNLSKKDVNDLLATTEFANSVIPSLYTCIPQKMLSYLNMWGEVIIKPLAGARGEGIICIKLMSNGKYLLSDTDKEIGTMNYEECVSSLSKMYHTTVIVQPRLKFTNKHGSIMDFRLNITKNGKGEWQTVFIIPRTSREKIISNFSQGGYASLLKPTLQLDYGEYSEKVYNELIRIAEKLPPIIEEASNCHMLSLGIDVGIEYDSLNPYIIEVNYVPKLTFPDKLKYHYIQSDYFAYIVNKLRDKSL